MNENGQRVIHFLNALTVGGKERVALKLARRARKQGLDHQLVLFDTPFRDGTQDLDPADVPCTFLPRKGGLDLRFTRAFARHVRDRNISVIHAHNDSAIVYAALARLFHRIEPRIIGTLHTRPSHATRAGRYLSRFAAGKIDVVTAVSPDLRAEQVATRWIRDAEVIWNGVDTAEYRPAAPNAHADQQNPIRSQLNLAPGDLLIGHVARFHPVKRQQDLLHAFLALAKSCPTAHLLFVGLGLLETSLAETVLNHPRIHWVAKIDDMSALYRELDIFVLCSSEEAAPLVLLEAMATGLPCITSNAGSCAEMIGASGHEPAGVLFEIARTRQLGAALQNLLTDPERRTQLGRLARKRACTRFSEEQEFANYARLYEPEGEASER